jgi:hypothetical protein
LYAVCLHAWVPGCLGALMPWCLHVTAPGTRLGRDSPASNLQLSLLPISLLHTGQGTCSKHAGHFSSILLPRQVPQRHAGGSSCGDRWSSTCRPTPHPRFACTSTGVVAARDTSSWGRLPRQSLIGPGSIRQRRVGRAFRGILVQGLGE